MTATDRLLRLVEVFATAPTQVRLQALLDYSRRLPDVPDRLLERPELVEVVPECQTPFALIAEGGAEAVHIHFQVPAESPTVRGFAGILHEGLDGAPAGEILVVPNDFYLRMGLQEAVSGQRLRGMGAILARLKGRVAELAG